MHSSLLLHDALGAKEASKAICKPPAPEKATVLPVGQGHLQNYSERRIKANKGLPIELLRQGMVLEDELILFFVSLSGWNMLELAPVAP